MWDWETLSNSTKFGYATLCARHCRDTDLSKMKPIPSWNLKYTQRATRQVKVEHEKAVEKFKCLGDHTNRGKWVEGANGYCLPLYHLWQTWLIDHNALYLSQISSLISSQQSRSEAIASESKLTHTTFFSRSSKVGVWRPEEPSWKSNV